LLVLVVAACGGSGGVASPASSPARYNVFEAENGTMTRASGDAFELALAGAGGRTFWFTLEGEDVLETGEEITDAFVPSGWNAQYGLASPVAIVMGIDPGGELVGYYLSLSNPRHDNRTGGLTFSARWVGGSDDPGFDPPEGAATEEILLLVSDEAGGDALDADGGATASPRGEALSPDPPPPPSLPSPYGDTTVRRAIDILEAAARQREAIRRAFEAQKQAMQVLNHAAVLGVKPPICLLSRGEMVEIRA